MSLTSPQKRRLLRESDRRMRELERRAHAGDTDAANQLRADQARTGYHGTKYEELAEVLGLKEPSKTHTRTTKEFGYDPYSRDFTSKQIREYFSTYVANLAEDPEFGIGKNIIGAAIELLIMLGLPDEASEVIQSTHPAENDSGWSAYFGFRRAIEDKLGIKIAGVIPRRILDSVAALKNPQISGLKPRHLVFDITTHLVKEVGLEEARKILIKHLLPQPND